MSQNRSEQIWPHFVKGEYFDSESVEFFLDYLPTVEQNASQFNPRHSSGSNEFDGFVPRWNFMSASNGTSENGETDEQVGI